MGKRKQEKHEFEKRQKQVRDAARKLFWKQGYSRTTMPQIAAEVGLAPGTLYLYFSGKSALYAALLEEGYEILLERLQEQLNGDLPPNQQAGAMIDVFIQFATEHPSYFDIIFFVFQREGAGWEGNLKDSQIERILAHEEACKAAVAQLLGRVLTKGSDDDRTAMVNAIWSMLAGMIFFFKGKEDFQEVAAQARSILLSAVFGT